MKIPNIFAVIYYKVKKWRNPTGNPSVDRTIKLSGKKIKIGCYTYGYEDTEILTWGEDINISIGRFCSIACGLKLFCGGNHRTDWVSTYPFGHVYNNYLNVNPVDGTPMTRGNITIGNDVWIGRDVTILSGISVGDGAVVAANSHVISNVDPYTIVGGNPARFIKKRFSDEIIERLLLLQWWNYPIEKIEEIIPYLCMSKDDNLDSQLNKIEEILNN